MSDKKKDNITVGRILLAAIWVTGIILAKKGSGLHL